MARIEQKGSQRGGRYWGTVLLLLLALSWLGAIVIGRVWESPLDIGWLLILGLYLYIGTAVWAGFNSTRPSRVPIFVEDPQEVGFEYETVSFDSRDGVALTGWYAPSQNGAVVICVHGFRENRLGCIPMARMLAKEGYGVLLFDLRGHGESDGSLSTGGWSEVQDLMGAVDYLCGRRQVNPRRLGVFGGSLGGQVALCAAAIEKNIAAVMADGAAAAVLADHTYNNRLHMSRQWLWHLIAYRVRGVLTGVKPPQGISASIGQIAPRPILLVVSGGRNERNTNHEFYRRAAEPREIWVVKEAHHGQVLEECPEEYEETLLDFFDYHLLGAIK